MLNYRNSTTTKIIAYGSSNLRKTVIWQNKEPSRSKELLSLEKEPKAATTARPPEHLEM